ncbi:methyltransferase [Fulvimarina endophytica]|uniref:Methyltransferase n=1 Tax=Fulvimarina endophytica TaxID=2293836 RepID=A0A371X236_9HYPH|nr:methyltransferase [Fulvimarina endophytica]RFC63293.1 methyltransferase [Fulvimarina endophytica]
MGDDAGAAALTDVAAVETRIDGFYGGRFQLVQPARIGYRSGLDALLLAATVSPDARGRLLDAGAGAGAVGFAASVRAPGLTATLLEREPVMAGCARQGLQLAANSGLRGRVRVVERDLLEKSAAQAPGEDAIGSYDHLLTNPPFRLPSDRVSPDPLRAAALNAPSPDFLAGWFRACLSLLRDGGRFAAILPPAVLPICLEVLSGRIGGPALTAIHAGEGEPAMRLVATGRKGSREPLVFLPPRHLFDRDMTASDFSRAVSEGEAFFGWPDRKGRTH